MFFKDGDSYGNLEQITSKSIRHILDLLDDYMEGKPYFIHEVRREDVNDKNNRIDIEISYQGENGLPVRQKLLILKDEVIDGATFHKRYSEWYA